MKLRKLSNETYMKRWESYIRETRKWESKGYNVIYLDYNEFRNEYDHLRKKQSRYTDYRKKENITRQLAKESRSFTKKQYEEISEKLKERGLTTPDFKDLTRQALFDLGLSLYDNDYRSADAFYNEVI